MFKVLSVREYDKIEEVKFSSGIGGGNGYVNMKKTHFVVVVAVTIGPGMQARKRIAFCPAHTYEFLGRTVYEGYAGDYELLVPGDIFEIQETKTFKKVVITQPAN
ncbi:MAG: hypothetical protein IJZ68_09260 [Bacteroidaceae bacterium]|nr:hypothetical protein [Bacteroidaceae bacterium]